MKIPVTHHKLQPGTVSLQSAGWIRGPQLLVHDQPAQKQGKQYIVPGRKRKVKIKLKGRFLDPVPNLIINNEKVEVVRSLTWYEYLWMALPILLVFQGGALGGIMGFMAAHTNARIFRSERGVASKFILSGFVSVAAVVIYFILAIIVVIIFEYIF